MPTTDTPTPLVDARVRPADWLVPRWPVADVVRGFVTTRAGGVSAAPYDTLNLGLSAPGAPRDDASAVAANRRIVAAHLPAPPAWLQQVHGADVVAIDASDEPDAEPPRADAAVTRTPGRPLVVLVADCLPVMLAARDGSVIGLAHAGWRGLAAGVLEATVGAMQCDAARVLGWLGPAAGPDGYEVGDEVLQAFATHDPDAASAFIPTRPEHWRVDLYALARRRLAAIGVTRVSGGGLCTISDPRRFYSHRRDQRTGRMATIVFRQ